MHVETIDRFRAIVTLRNQGHDKRSEIWMSLITCGSIHEGHEWFSITLEEDEIFMCLTVLLCEQFCRFVNVGAKI